MLPTSCTKPVPLTMALKTRPHRRLKCRRHIDLMNTQLVDLITDDAFIPLNGVPDEWCEDPANNAHFAMISSLTSSLLNTWPHRT